MMRKICPCNSCAQTQQCVSHDNMRFYCNRCLPNYVRQQWYWMENTNSEQPKTFGNATIEVPKIQKESSKSKKS